MGFSKQYETVSERYSEPSQTSKMELFVKVVQGWSPLTISAKNFIINVLLSSEYASEFSCKQSMGWYAWNAHTHEKSTKNQSVTEWYKCVKCGAMDKNVECFSCHKVEAVKCFELLGMRYGDVNVVTQRV